MVCCSAINCKNKSSPTMRLFRFPAEVSRRKIWIRNMRRMWTPTSTARLCQVHFDESQFEMKRMDGRKLLKPNAIPTFFDFNNPPPKIGIDRPAKRYKKPSVLKMADDQAIKNLQTYLRIPSVQPDVDYGQAKEIGLECVVHEFIPKKPVVIMTWNGSNSAARSILLNSHMDVVPVSPELWTHDPFGAEIDAEGNIYARGTQDTKGSGIQFLEAVRRLKDSGISPMRTVHISFVPDEEDGTDGMEQFITTPEFKALNVGFTVDEGSSNPGPEILVFYAEKAIWHVNFNITGTAGHGSLPLPDTAGEKLRRVMDRIMQYREQQLQILQNNPSLTVGDITFVNCTIIQGGLAPNVVPSVFKASFDFRLAVDEDHDKFAALLETWAKEAGDGIEVEYYLREPVTPATPVYDSNPFWLAFKKTFDDLGQKIILGILAGGTDSRFLRRIGIPCIAMSPMNHMPELAHANDEYINKDVFLRGIQIFMKLIQALTSVAP